MSAKKLTSAEVASLAKEPGKHNVGEGLVLRVTKGGSARWSFVYRFKRPGAVGAGSVHELGVGSFPDVSLKDARAAVAAARAQLKAKVNPLDARKAASAVPTFGAMADEVVASLSAGMKNEKARYRLKRALEHHAKALRELPVNEVSTDDVLRALKPLWMAKPDTASKLRGYIERVLSAARAKGHRSGENPAAWRGHLDHLLPKQPKLVRGHHAALPFDDMPGFMAELRSRDAVAARALEFVILTWARSGEVIGARWSEIDLAARVWTVPAARMKSGREHRVPLSDRAAAILDEMAALRTTKAADEFVFPGRAKGGSLSNMAFAALLRRMRREELTTHGFRSTARDWAGEATAFTREVAEAALAHAVGDEVERAYRRGDALAKRRNLMDAWTGFCGSGGEGAKVVELRRQARQ